MVAGRIAFVTAGVELANDASFALLRVSDQGFGILEPRVVDSEFDELDAHFLKANDTRKRRERWSQSVGGPFRQCIVE